MKWLQPASYLFYIVAVMVAIGIAVISTFFSDSLNEDRGIRGC